VILLVQEPVYHCSTFNQTSNSSYLYEHAAYFETTIGTLKLCGIQ